MQQDTLDINLLEIEKSLERLEGSCFWTNNYKYSPLLKNKDFKK